MVGSFADVITLPPTAQGVVTTISIQVRALPQGPASLAVSDGYEDLFVYSCGYSASADGFNDFGLAQEVLYLSTGATGTLPDPTRQGLGYIAVDAARIPYGSSSFDSRALVESFVSMMRTVPQEMAAGDPPVVTSKP